MSESGLLLAGFLLVAMLYASVGHGGATGYLALLSLLLPALPQREASTTALVLNTVVSGLALTQFAGAGHFPARLARAFLVTSIPFTFLGGLLAVPMWLFHLLLLVGLAAAAMRLLFLSWGNSLAEGNSTTAVQPPKAPVAGVVGAVVGLVSGIVGIGGGVFLSPLLILLRWATPRDTAGIAASFVLLNSIAGLLSRGISDRLSVGSLGMPLTVALAGGLIGSYLGARRLVPVTMNRVLAVVLLVACGKLLISLASAFSSGGWW